MDSFPSAQHLSWATTALLAYFGLRLIYLALGVSPQTVLRDWSLAKAWLTRELSHGDS